MSRTLPVIAVLGWLTLVPLTAHADYVLSPTSGGQASTTVAPGGAFSLALDLASASADYHWAAVFTVDFSQPGLRYLGHSWAAPYATTSIDNRSVPGNGQVPVTLAADTYRATSNDPGTVDLYFENFLEIGQFESGTLLTLNLEVPAGFPAGAVTIRALPIAFDNGQLIPTTGGLFTLNVQAGPTARTWSGAGGDSNLATAANWLNGPPGAADPIVFGAAGAAMLTPTNGGATPLSAVGGITFDAAGYTLGGPSPLKVSGAITNNAAAATIDVPLILAGSGTINVIAGGELTISQPLSGDQGLTKSGLGMLELLQDAAYTGNTDVQAGTLVLPGLTGSGSTTVGGTLIADHIRQDTLTITAGGLVEIAASGPPAPIASGVAADMAPVPEPATWLLLTVAALAGLVAWRSAPLRSKQQGFGLGLTTASGPGRRAHRSRQPPLSGGLQGAGAGK